jgi:hypothetical protein
MTDNRLQYAIAIANNKCSFVALINGFPFFINTDGLAYNLSVPVNPYIKKDDNDIRILIRPMKDESNLLVDTELKMEVLVKTVDDLPVNFKTIYQLQMPNGISTAEAPLPGFLLEGKLKVEWPIVFDWVNAKKIKGEVDHASQFVINQYKFIHTLLSKRDISSIAELIYKREQEMSAAYYEDFNKGFEDSVNLIKNTVSDPEFVLQPLQFTDFIVDYAAEDRVIYMHDEYYNQPICFINKTQGIRRELPFYFILNGDYNLQIIR